MDFQRIATEEAFSPPEMMDCYRDILRDGTLDDPGFYSLWGHYLTSDDARPRAIRSKLIDLDGRIHYSDPVSVTIATAVAGHAPRWRRDDRWWV